MPRKTERDPGAEVLLEKEVVEETSRLLNRPPPHLLLSRGLIFEDLYQRVAEVANQKCQIYFEFRFKLRHLIREMTLQAAERQGYRIDEGILIPKAESVASY